MAFVNSKGTFCWYTCWQYQCSLNAELYFQNNSLNEQDKQTGTHGHGLQTSGYQRVGSRGGGVGRQLKGVKYSGEEEGEMGKGDQIYGS